MAATGNHQIGGEKMRVLRIAHSSLTPALRQRERALVRCYPDVDLEVVTTPRWREAEMEVEATPDDLFSVHTARTYLSKHIQLFAYDPGPIVAALRRHRPHLIDRYARKPKHPSSLSTAFQLAGTTRIQTRFRSLCLQQNGKRRITG